MDDQAGDITIRAAARSDAAALAELARRTFIETYAAMTPPADLSAYVAESFTVERWVALLGERHVRCMVAESSSGLVGYALLRAGPIPREVADGTAIELVRLYTDRQWQGRGLGRDLLGQALAAARGLDRRTIWLSVWERNATAIAFYERHGFRMVGRQTFTVGTDVQHDRLMARAV